MRNYKISVAMATYNGENYIKEQIESILMNLLKQDEIIISDDGSTDHTIEMIKNFHDSRITIIKGPQKGVIKNFENAISHCHGDVIFLADQDDVWLPNKVTEVLNVFEQNQKIILVVHDNQMVNENKELIQDSFFEFRGCKNGLVNNLIKNSFIGCCMAFRKELNSVILPIPSNVPMHDQWIGLKALLKGNVCFYEKKLLLYRRHETNVSHFKKNSLGKMIKNRFLLLKNLIYYKEV